MRSCAVPAADQPEVCAPAELHTGDGEAIELGLLGAPTPFTWRSQQRVKLASHRYRDDGAHTASLRWGEVTAEVTVAPEMYARDIAGQPAIERPTVTLFAVNAVADSIETVVNTQVRNQSGRSIPARVCK